MKHGSSSHCEMRCSTNDFILFFLIFTRISGILAISNHVSFAITTLLFCRVLILFLNSHLCLFFSISLLLDLFLLQFMLNFPLLLFLSLSLFDFFFAFMDPRLILIVQATLAARLNVDIEDLILFL